MKTVKFRITLKDYKLLRGIIPGMRGEASADYFHRVIKALELAEGKQ